MAYNPYEQYGVGAPIGNNPNDNFIADPMQLRRMTENSPRQLNPTQFMGGSPNFNESANLNQPAPKPNYGGGGIGLEQMRKQANKALHSAKTPQQRQAAAANLAGIRDQINQSKLGAMNPYNEGRSAPRIAQDIGTPNVRRIDPRQPSQPGQPPMFGPGGEQGPLLPGGPGGYYPGGDARSMLGQVFDASMNGSITSFNTSANRLRERLDAQTQGMANQAQNRNLGRGFGASGLNDADQFRVQQMGQANYAQGLNELSNQFEQNRLQGLNTAFGAGNAMRESEDNYSDNQFDLLNNREGRKSAEGIAGADRSSREGMAASDRELQKILAELMQKNENFRTSLNLGNNKTPDVTTIPGLGSTIGGGGIRESGPGGSLDNGALFGFPTGTFPEYGAKKNDGLYSG